MDEKGQIIKIDGAEIELRMETSLAPSALRAFLGATPMDAEIDAMPVPNKPLWLWTCVFLLRWYRRVRPQYIGHRCVFDPSCSRYSELSFRQHGLVMGSILTMKRLRRCKPGSGGIDVP